MPAFCVLLRKLKQQWAELYCTDVGAGVKKDSGPYTFVYHAADRGEYRQAAGPPPKAMTEERRGGCRVLAAKWTGKK